MKPTNRLFSIMSFLLIIIIIHCFSMSYPPDNNLTAKMVYHSWQKNSEQLKENYDNNPKNYINSYSTISQTIIVPNTFQIILFDKDSASQAWKREGGSFKVPKTGHYLISYSIIVSFPVNASIPEQLLTHAVLDDQALTESRCLWKMSSNQPIANFNQTFILHAKKGQLLTVQIKTNSLNGGISTVTIPSAFITITSINS